MWCILLPFIYIFDRLFGGWEDKKEMWKSHPIFGEWKNEKEKTIRQSKRD